MARSPWLGALLSKKTLGLVADMVVNFVLPYLIYTYLNGRYGDVNALMASAGPPIVWSLGEFALRRRIDALSMIVLAGIVLSLLAFLGGGSARFLLLREKMVTGAIGVVLLGSAAIGRPLIYQLARAALLRSDAAEAERLEGMRDNPYFRRTMTVMTLVWGFGFLADVLVAVLFVFTLTIPHYLIVNSIMSYVVTGGLGAWTFFYARNQQRRGDARRAAERASTDMTATPEQEPQRI